MTDIKPCPFCESTRIMFGTQFVNCMDCGALIMGKSSREEAITAWNTRSDRDEMPGWMRERIEKEIELHTTGSLCYGALDWILTMKKGEE